MPEDSEALAADRDRMAHPLGPCPGCGRGALQPGNLAGERVATCDGCRRVWLKAGQVARMRARVLRGVVRTEERSQMEGAAERFRAAERMEFDTVLGNAAALPGALLLGVVVHGLGFSGFVWGTFEMWFHELGHAIVAWLGGFVAVPLPFFTMTPRSTRSVSVSLVVLGMIGAIAYESKKRAMWGALAFAGVLLVAQAFLTLVLTPNEATEWVIFAGQAGAIVLPVVVMLAFYQPVGWRWDFWRFVAVAVAGIGFVHAMFVWVGVALGTAVMPHGSAVGKESEGDMERLVARYGWTSTGLAGTYLTIGVACLVVLSVAYAFYLRRALARGPEPRTVNAR
jgi:Zn-finger nucleic acid-binding protein